jgi:hypothetical protein
VYQSKPAQNFITDADPDDFGQDPTSQNRPDADPVLCKFCNKLLYIKKRLFSKMAYETYLLIEKLKYI